MSKIEEVLRKIYRFFQSCFFSSFMEGRNSLSLLLKSVDRNPLAKCPKASRKTYEALAISAAGQQYPEIDDFERQCGFAIDQEWLNHLALHTQVVVKKSPLCYAHGRILYSALCKFLKTLDSNHSVNIIETGTARGFSGLCMAKALNDMGRYGSVVTIDILPHRIPIYWNCIDDLDRKKTRQELLAPWRTLVEKYLVFVQGDSKFLLPKLAIDRVHLAFLDGAHTKEDVLFEFDQISSSQRQGDLIIFDDYTIDQFPGIVAAVDEICVSANYLKQTLNSHERRGYVVATKADSSSRD